MKKKWMISFLCVIVLGTLLGYLYSVKAKNKPVIDIVLKNSSSQYWKYMRAGLVKGYANMGAAGNIYVPGKDDENQLKILQRLLKEKPDALVVALNNPKAAEPILNKYKNENIPVLLIDTESDWPDQTCYIGTDNITLGQKAGELLSSMLQPDDKVALIGQAANNNISITRTKGAKQTLTAAGIDIAADIMIPEKNYKIKSIMDGILQNAPDLKGIYAVNDEIAIEVLKYINEKGLNLQVIGSDGNIDMIQDVEKGILKGTIAQNPYDIGYMGIENAMKAIKGESIEKKINSDVDIITSDNAKNKIDFLDQIL